MLHLLLIVMIASLLLRDSVPAEAGVPLLSAWWAAAWTLGLTALTVVLHLGVVRWCGGRIDERGSHAHVRLANWADATARATTAVVFALGASVLGWLDAVRLVLGGDRFMIDEVLAIGPSLLALVMIWSSQFEIDRRLHEAAIIHDLDMGRSIAPLPTRGRYVWDQVRHQLLIVLVPISLIATWTEGVDRVLEVLAPRLEGLPEWAPGALGSALHFAGIAGVIVFMPQVLRVMWDTVSLGPGELRERLESMCRAQGVGFRDILVWRTQQKLLNGAVVGVTPSMRYILLTDELLERLTPLQLEAVMAHEVAHARRHHLPWLMASMIVFVTLAWTGAQWLTDRQWPSADPQSGPAALSAIVSAAAALGLGVLMFGWISRRFEQQADAFAAQHLSGRVRASESRTDLPITPEAAQAMASALATVADLNHIPRERFSWRHGSIAQRMRTLARLPGTPSHRLPIDSTVRVMQICTIVGAGAIVALALM